MSLYVEQSRMPIRRTQRSLGVAGGIVFATSSTGVLL